jgi:hypothetical protein
VVLRLRMIRKWHTDAMRFRRCARIVSEIYHRLTFVLGWGIESRD